jgi:cytochrome c peroxidase
MKNVFLAVFLAVAVQPVLTSADVAVPGTNDRESARTGESDGVIKNAGVVESKAAIESAWLAFTNARGEAALIRGDVDHPSANDIFRVIPDIDMDSLNEEKLQLGTELFNDGRLSRDGSLSCASCHIALLGGVDRSPVSFGIGRAMGELNAPTIFNAALNFRQFWDGRALTLQEQALGPIENPIELGHDLDTLIGMLESIPEYKRAFDRLYPDGVTAANLGDAIAYYEIINFTGLDSPFLSQFDAQHEPLNAKARRGQQRFVEVGCASCHNGVNLGGNSYQQLGVAETWYGDDRPALEADDGLFGRSGREQDRHVFKVPTLHNVAATGPWFHDGSITSLQQAVDQMARHQLGRYLDNSDIDEIAAFLRSLGDSQSLIGDCAVSGTYSATMDCSVSHRGSGVTQDDAPVLVTLPDPTVLARQHQQAYAEALDRAVTAPTRIAAEMQRVRSGQVAHYDFVQYEHIEMLRHARALSFPPANLELEQRRELLAQAEQLQQTAGEYEFIIADFLRSQAVSSSARANIQDLLRIMAIDADEKTVSLLGRAEQSLLTFYGMPGPTTQKDFESATRALSQFDLDPQQLSELQLHVRLLLENLPMTRG